MEEKAAKVAAGKSALERYKRAQQARQKRQETAATASAADQTHSVRFILLPLEHPTSCLSCEYEWRGGEGQRRGDRVTIVTRTRG